MNATQSAGKTKTSQLINQVLPLVTKPIRYTGGEYNVYIKPAEDHPIYFGLIMPEVYEIGMSNYGLKVLYSVLNRDENIIAERAFAPWLDYGVHLKEKNIPLYSLETKKPLNQFNILGFSLQSELSYTNILYVLDLAQIPLHSKDRNEKHPLIIAGGPCCVNPLPIQDFIDAFVIGDGEEVVLEISEVYKNWNKINRDDLLKMLSAIKGVYVPLIHDKEKCVINKRNVTILKEDDFPYPPVVPICETVHDRLTIEIGRGCIRGCRFCQAGFLNRPIRMRSVPEILRLAERGIRATGWEELSLLSLSALDYPFLQELLAQLTRQMSKRRVAISLPSMRGEDFNTEIARSLQAIKKTGLTFAPETASPRLRSMVNKEISEDKIFSSISAAVYAGWRNIKLYFMIGLPNEENTDLDALSAFVNQAARIAPRIQIKFSLTPFIPKPHTPLQWAGFESTDTLKTKIDYIRDSVKRRNANAKWENPDVSFIQAILARGDEKLNNLIYNVYKKGGIFQDWTEKFDIGNWKASIANQNINTENYLRPANPETRLPWDFIDIGINKNYLKQEYNKAVNFEQTANCQENCQNCGVKGCELNPSPNYSEDTNANEPEPKQTKPAFDYRLTSDDFKTNYPLGSDGIFENQRFRIKYTVGESFRYAGHLDRVRSIYRTLRRSELPIAYTKGFSPHPIVSFGPPLPVGVISSGEYLDLEIARSYNGNIVRDLGLFLPRDMRIVQSRLINRRTDSLGKSCNLAQYEIKNIAWEINQGLLERQKNQIPGIKNMEFNDNQTMRLMLMIAPKMKLFDILAQLYQKDDAQVRCLNIERKDFYVVKNEKVLSPMDDDYSQ